MSEYYNPDQPEYFHAPTPGITTPKHTWKVTIGGAMGLEISFVKPPNRFHRVMQRIIFGFKWEKI